MDELIIKLSIRYGFIPLLLRKLIQMYSTGRKIPWYFCILFWLTQFTLFVYKFLIDIVEIFKKYHWIQHKITQPVVVLSEPID